MAIEIEAKMKVDDLAAVRERLHEHGAEHLGEFLETNTFFDTSNRSLLAGDKGLRLRLSQNLRSNEESFVLTFKGPRQQGELKTREEIELPVGSGRDAIDLLQSLGFDRVLTFDKKRQSWKLDGCKVELDELPHLGTYVEIEGPRDELILSVRDKLGLSTRPLIKTSYIAMLVEHLKRHGLPEGVVTFAD